MRLVIHKASLVRLTIIAFAVAMLCVPWGSIFVSANGYGFVDRMVYENYFLGRESVLSYRRFETIVDYVSNEFLWHAVVGWLIGGVGVPVDVVFGAISLATVLVFSQIIVRKAGVSALIFLVNPLVVDFAFSQLRLALAVSLLGAAYLLNGRQRILPVALVAATPFIHTGALIFVGVYFVVATTRVLVEKYKQSGLFEVGVLLAVGAMISLAIGPLRVHLLSLMGDRRADYHDMSSSAMYSLFWISLLIPLILRYQHIMRHDFARYTLVILSVVAVNLLHGGYSTRFLAAVLPFIVASVFLLPRAYFIPVVFAFSFYAALQWLYWLRLLGV